VSFKPVVHVVFAVGADTLFVLQQRAGQQNATRRKIG